MCRNCSKDDWGMARRDLFRAAGVTWAAYVLGNGGLTDSLQAQTTEQRRKRPAVVRAAFLYPPTEQLKKEGYYSWPGSGFDPEGRQKEYASKLGEIARKLGVQLAVDQGPLYGSEAVSRFIGEVKDQQPDGRVSIAPEHPDAFWPTPLAILAWHQAPAFREARGKAVQFLIKNAGRHFPKQKDSEGHDPAIKGWPWILDTSSWVVPTSLAVIALRVTGHGRHERVQEALRLLLDRQLPAGGWNYGSTTLFGQQLHPMPENTGMALNALAESAPLESVAKSLAYLKDRMAHVRTPIALSWSLLGLGAWGERPPEAAEWLSDCWRQQGRYGIYDTTSISLMLIALTAQRGIVSLFGPEGG